MRRVLPLVTTVVAETAAVVALHLLGRVPGFGVPYAHLEAWLRVAPIDDAVAATLRLVALAGAWWLLLSTLLYVASALAGAPRAIRVAAHITLPAIRRRIDRTLAVSVVAGTLLVTSTPAFADTPPDPGPDPSTTTTTAVVRTGRTGDPNAVTPLSTTADTTPSEPAPEPATPSTTAATTPPSHTPTTARAPLPAATPVPAPLPTTLPSADATSYTVVEGDSFWAIAARHLAQVTARDRTTLRNDEIARYWVKVCDANRSTIRSGDVNLIYPGEVVQLPSV